METKLEHHEKVCATLLYFVYLLLSIYGCLNIKEGLDPKFLVRESFYLSNFYKLIDQSFWMEGLQMQVVVNRPPDLFNTTMREKFSKMMSDFENTQFTMNHNATMIWLNAYELHLEREKNELNIEKPASSSEWYHRCRDWLLVAGGRRLWEKDMVWGQTEEGASSTILGIMVLTLVDAYIVEIFFKTVFLVISFSMLHGLLFLPVLLMIIIPEKRAKKSANKIHDKPRAVFTCSDPEDKEDLGRKAPSRHISSMDDLKKKGVPNKINLTVEPAPGEEPLDEDVVKATVDRLTGKILTPDYHSPK
ncbi:hypothetical protein NECAME_01997 [Necator americanus]|uniref:SSD domain-containing protein n=1 Tax=Necator americanus TaxID=51031 RepID=W2TJL5_NECAM|nr:hypothetical protein NECAME_01997 [Necator americanus]ETN82260.1 hypothetical protein NECAME_01997 [Necator americanus]